MSCFRSRRLLKASRKNEKVLEKLAYFDQLTGVGNRLQFNKETPKMLEQARNAQQRVAFLLIDIDGFKSINDNYGHDIGDKFLKTICEVIQRVVDKHIKKSLLTRLGGDEFVLFLSDIEDARQIIEIVNNIYEQFGDPLQVKEYDINAHISMGISIFPYDGLTISGLLKAADLALYTAKENGKNTFYFHDKKMNSRYERLHEYQQAIKYFVETKDFWLKYQPIVNTSNQKIRGVEVLFGGNEVKYPDINIEEMIKVAEDNDTIIDLGTLILEKACHDYVNNFPEQLKSNKFFISVNVSAKQLDDEMFVERVRRILEKTKIPPPILNIEITETDIIKNYTDVRAKMKELKTLGIRFCIDDFGKGYSSMSYLRNLDVSKIKIDKQFIDDITDKKSSEIVKTIVLMAKTLNLVCVAEGIETKEQLEFLQQIKCDCVQGYLVHKGCRVEDLTKLC